MFWLRRGYTEWQEEREERAGAKRNRGGEGGGCESETSKVCERGHCLLHSWQAHTEERRDEEERHWKAEALGRRPPRPPVARTHSARL